MTPIGLQMYTLREETDKDFSGTLEKVASLGYKGVEFAGFGGLAATEVKHLLERLDLTVIGSHTPLDQLEHHLDEVIAYQKGIGSQRIICPFLPPEQRTEAGYKRLITILNQASERCEQDGISLFYHHHDFELEQRNGQTWLEKILAETKSLKLELDIYWLIYAGEDPLKWMEVYQNRASLVHLKDMAADRFFTELGEGNINLKPIIQLAKTNNYDWLIVEQDQCRRPPLESVEISITYLQRLGVM